MQKEVNRRLRWSIDTVDDVADACPYQAVIQSGLGVLCRTTMHTLARMRRRRLKTEIYLVTKIAFSKRKRTIMPHPVKSIFSSAQMA